MTLKSTDKLAISLAERALILSIILKTFPRNIKVIHLEFNEIEFISDSIGALLNLKQLYPTGFRTIKNLIKYNI